MAADLKLALRALRRSPAFASLVILLLALGIGINTAMFSILDAWLLEPLHFPQPNRLAILLKSEVTHPTEPKIFVGYREFEEWARQSRSFTNLAAVFWRSFESAEPDANDDIFGMIVSANLFDTLQVHAEKGRTFLPGDVNGPPVAVIGHEFCEQRFGGIAGSIGKIIHAGSKSYRIIGVMPPGFGLRIIDQAADTQFYALIQGDEKGYRAGGAGPVAVIGRLKPGVAIPAAQQELAAIQRRLDQKYPDNPRGFTVLATNLHQDNTRNVRASLWLSAAAVGFVLLIVCANVGSLLLGRTLERRREMAIRAALGSGRRRIVHQLLAESALIALLGALAGIGLAYSAIRIFTAVNPFGRMPPNPIALDWRALAFTLAATIASTLFSGLPAAWQAAKADFNDIIKATGRSLTAGHGTLRLRAALVIGQIALSLVLVIGATLMLQTLARLESHPLGFRTRNVSVIDLNMPRGQATDVAQRQQLYERVVEKLNALPGVQSAAISDLGPLSTSFEEKFTIEGQPEPSDDSAPKAGHQAVTPGYFATLGIPLLRGRSFNAHDDAASAKVVILNQAAEQRWFTSRSAIGAHVRFKDDKDWRTVVGVAGDTASVFYNKVEWLTDPRIFLPIKQTTGDSASPVARQVYALVYGRAFTGNSARGLLRSIDPAIKPGRVRQMPEVIGEAVRQPVLRTRLLASFAIIALLLAAIGLYGLMVQSVIQRMHEIGIRVALGAQANDMARLIVGQGLRLAAIGILMGVLLALAATRVLSGLLYGVRPTDPLSIAGAALILLAAVLLASFLPARSAASVDPMVALRQE